MFCLYASSSASGVLTLHVVVWQAVHTEGQVVSLAKELVQHEQQVCSEFRPSELPDVWVLTIPINCCSLSYAVMLLDGLKCVLICNALLLVSCIALLPESLDRLANTLVCRLQVLQAVSNEAKAVQVAATFQTIEEAAEKLDGAREEAAATMDAVAQVHGCCQQLGSPVSQQVSRTLRRNLRGLNTGHRRARGRRLRPQACDGCRRCQHHAFIRLLSMRHTGRSGVHRAGQRHRRRQWHTGG